MKDTDVQAYAAAPAGAAGPKGNRPIWKGNWTPWLVIAAAYSFVFLGALGLPWLPTAPPLIASHIVFAVVVTLACVWNLLHTPSHGPLYRRAHIIVGWIAMASGAATVCLGAAIVLAGQSFLSPTGQIAFLVTGAFQLVLQGLGVAFIRWRGDVASHMKAMTILFFASVVMPGVNRLPLLVGAPALGEAWTFGSMAIGFVLAFVAIWWNTYRDVR